MKSMYKRILVASSLFFSVEAFSAKPTITFDANFHKDSASSIHRMVTGAPTRFKVTVSDVDGDIASLEWFSRKAGAGPKVSIKKHTYQGSNTNKTFKTVHHFDSPGRYYISAVAKDKNGASSGKRIYIFDVSEPLRGMYVPKTATLVQANNGAEVDELFRYCRQYGINQLTLYSVWDLSNTELENFITRAKSSSVGDPTTAGADIKEINIVVGKPTKTSIDKVIALHNALDPAKSFDGVVTEDEYWHDRAVNFPIFLGSPSVDGVSYLHNMRNQQVSNGKPSFSIGAYLSGPTGDEVEDLKQYLDVFYLTDYVGSYDKIYGNKNQKGVIELQLPINANVGSTEVRPIFQMTNGNSGLLDDYEAYGTTDIEREEFLGNVEQRYLDRHYLDANRYRVFINGSLYFSYSLINRDNATFYPPALKQVFVDGVRYTPTTIPDLPVGVSKDIMAVVADPNIDPVSVDWVVTTVGGTPVDTMLDTNLGHLNNKRTSTWTHTFTNAGIYNVMLTITDSAGNVATKLVKLTVI